MTDDDRKVKLHDFTVQILQSQIELFWKRSLFFWGFNGAALVTYGALVDKADKDIPIGIGCFGLICALTWTLANRSCKYWQYSWEQRLRSVQKETLGREIYFEIVPNAAWKWWGAWRHSLIKLTIALSDFSVLLWLVLILKASPTIQGRPWGCISITIAVATAIYAIAIFVGARSDSLAADHAPSQ